MKRDSIIELCFREKHHATKDNLQNKIFKEPDETVATAQDTFPKLTHKNLEVAHGIHLIN